MVCEKITNIVASHESTPDVLKNDEEIIYGIIDSLLSKGGRVKYNFLDSKLLRVILEPSSDVSEKHKKIDNELKSLAYKGIINSNTQGEVLYTEVDNIYLYMRYSQDVVIEVTKIADNPRVKGLGLKRHIFHIGGSVVEVDNTGEKRNYTNVEKGSIEMSSITDEVGKISIYLSPGQGNSNKIKVEIDKENEARLNELKSKGKSLGENCLLGGKSVLQAIEDKSFGKDVDGSIQSTETIRQLNDAKNQTASTSMEQICTDQLQKESKIGPHVS